MEKKNKNEAEKNSKLNLRPFLVMLYKFRDVSGVYHHHSLGDLSKARDGRTFLLGETSCWKATDRSQVREAQNSSQQRQGRKAEV